MSDRSELRRLAEVTRTAWEFWGSIPVPSESAQRRYAEALRDLEHALFDDPQTVLALLDAAERAEQATELLRAVTGAGPLTVEDEYRCFDCGWPRNADDIYLPDEHRYAEATDDLEPKPGKLRGLEAWEAWEDNPVDTGLHAPTCRWVLAFHFLAEVDSRG